MIFVCSVHSGWRFCRWGVAVPTPPHCVPAGVPDCRSCRSSFVPLRYRLIGRSVPFYFCSPRFTVNSVDFDSVHDTFRFASLVYLPRSFIALPVAHHTVGSHHAVLYTDFVSPPHTTAPFTTPFHADFTPPACHVHSPFATFVPFSARSCTAHRLLRHIHVLLVHTVTVCVLRSCTFLRSVPMHHTYACATDTVCHTATHCLRSCLGYIVYHACRLRSFLFG